MEPKYNNSLREVFLEAVERTDPKSRAEYLNQACAGNAELRRRVERLLAAEAQAGGPPPADDTNTPAPLTSDPMLGRRIGRYRLLQQIGEGGCGVVFMAAQEGPVRRKVALKILKLGMDTKNVIARFEAERQALALMDHPCIAQVFDAGATDTGRPYFVMELVRGIKITDFCNQKHVSRPERLDLFMQVCHAVQHAHQKGIIHRDLKPSNILVTELDGTPLPKIIDFGIAKAVEGRLTDQTLFTAFEQFIGTPAYMSPEQAALNAADVDTRSDIYSLGVLLYELLTGATPFDTQSLLASGLDEMRRTIREVTPLRPSTRIRQTSATSDPASSQAMGHSRLATDLDWIVMKCLDKDRGRRYQTANGLALDVGRHLNNEPILARPPSRLYEFCKTVRRHWVGFGATAALILVLAAGLAGVWWQWRRAVTAEREAGWERDRAELLAAEAALEKGQSKLETGDSWGLLDLVEAYGLAEHNPTFQETIGRRWSTWYAEWDRRTIAVRHTSGIPSPNHLQSATLSDWPPNNNSPVINLKDTLTGKTITGPLVHESNAKGGAFSPDGRLFATVTERGVIHLWDCRTGAPVRPPCESGITEINKLSFSNDGRFLVAFWGANVNPRATKIAILRLDESEGSAYIREHRYPVEKALFSPDSKLLAVLCKPDLQLWRTADLQPAGPPIPVNLSGLLEFNADGTRLAINPQGSGELGLLDPQTQQIIHSLPAGLYHRICSFSHDGRLLAALHWGDGNLSLWKMTDSAGEPYATQKMGRRIYGRLSFNPDDSLLAAGDAAGTIRVMSVSDGRTIHTVHAFPNAAAAHFLTNGILAASGEHSGFWDISSSPLPGSVLPHDALGYSLAFDSSGAFLAVGSEGELRLWRIEASPRLERIISMPGRVLALTFSQAEDQFVAFSDDGSLTRVEPRTGTTRRIRHIDRGYELSARLSPDGRKLVLFRYNEAFVVETQTGAIQRLGYEGGTRSVAFRRDSQEMAVGVARSAVCLYNLSTAAPTFLGRSPSLGGWVDGVAYHPGSRLLAVCVEGRVIRLYNPDTNRQVLSDYEPSLASVDLLRFSPDGTLLATAGPRQSGGHGIEIWHLDPERGLYRGASILPCEHPIRSMTFSPDSRTLVAGGLGSTRLWHLPPAPKNLGQVQSRTWVTLGFRLDEHGNADFMERPIHDVEDIRARLTQNPTSSITPLESALILPPVEALTALQALDDQHQGETVYKKLQGHLHADLMVTQAEQGQWKEALAHANEAIRLDGADPHTRFQHALLLLQAGDVEGYRESCLSMTERYKSCDDPAVIKWVAFAAALRAGALDDYTELVKHVRRSVSIVGGIDAPTFRFYLGTVLVRAERYAEAVTELEPMDRHLGAAWAKVDISPIHYKFLLAICHAHLGHQDTAHEWFDVAAKDTQHLLDQGDTGVFWTDTLIITLLHQEAETALSTLLPVPERSQ